MARRGAAGHAGMAVYSAARVRQADGRGFGRDWADSTVACCRQFYYAFYNTFNGLESVDAMRARLDSVDTTALVADAHAMKERVLGDQRVAEAQQKVSQLEKQIKALPFNVSAPT